MEPIITEELKDNPAYSEIDFDPTRKPPRSFSRKAANILGLAPIIIGSRLWGIKTETGEVVRTESFFDVAENFCTPLNKIFLFVTWDSILIDGIIKLLHPDAVDALMKHRRVSAHGFQIFHLPGAKLTISKSGRSFVVNTISRWAGHLGLDSFKALFHISDPVPGCYAEIAKRINRAGASIWGDDNAELFSPSILTRKALEETYKQVDAGSIPEEVYQFAYECLHGPWVEIFQQGLIPDAYNYDLNSAYPKEIAQLIQIDSSCGEWSPVEEYDPKADYGFYMAYITIGERKLSPVMFRKMKRLFTPYGSWIGYITQEEIAFIREANLGSVLIIRGWVFRAKLYIHPFSYPHRVLAQIRQEAVDSGDMGKRLVAKAASVFTFGKMLQKYQDYPSGKIIASPTFNPIYACVVLVRTKLRIARAIVRAPGRVAAVMVDGIITRGPISMPLDMRQDAKGEAVILHNLMYQIGSKHSEWRIRERIEDAPLQRHYDFGKDGFIGLCEALQGRRLDKTLESIYRPHVVRVGSDSKRVWREFPVYGEDLLNETYESYPFHVQLLDVIGGR